MATDLNMTPLVVDVVCSVAWLVIVIDWRLDGVLIAVAVDAADVSHLHCTSVSGSAGVHVATSVHWSFVAVVVEAFYSHHHLPFANASH